MNISQQIATHFRQIHFGGNWTVSNLKDLTSDLTWQQANQKIQDFNTVHTLVYHTTYYVNVLLDVLEGSPLNAKDEWSFQHPPISNQKEWEELINTALDQAEKTARLIEKLPITIWEEDFTDKKYGTYYRNVIGTIEHMHYHLGQIALLKKLLKSNPLS